MVPLTWSFHLFPPLVVLSRYASFTNYSPCVRIGKNNLI